MNQILQVDRAELRAELSAIIAELKESAELQAAENVMNLTLTAEQTAKTLSVSLPTLWRWSKSGQLKPIFIGGRKLYKTKDVLKLLNNGMQ